MANDYTILDSVVSRCGPNVQTDILTTKSDGL